MPLREFICEDDQTLTEVYDPSVDPEGVPIPMCAHCHQPMHMIWSVPQVDTADNFHPFDYRGPDGRQWAITNLRKLRSVEHEYTKTGHNVRFDAYSAEPNNPDTVDGMGMPYNPRDDSAPAQTPKKLYSIM